MLELRPNCEMCDIDLPVDAAHARICSYECTFCEDCVVKLANVCPNCGGGFSVRPIRPQKDWRAGVSAQHQAPGIKRVHSKYSFDELRNYIDEIKSIPPEKR